MKKAVNITSFALTVAGLSFKLEHWPGANVLLILSTFAMIFITIFYAFKDNKESGISDKFNYIISAFLVIIVVGALFRIMHWPGSPEIFAVGEILTIALPLALIITGEELKISKQYFSVFLTAFMIIIALMRFNPLLIHHDEDSNPQITTGTENIK